MHNPRAFHQNVKPLSGPHSITRSPSSIIGMHFPQRPSSLVTVGDRRSPDVALIAVGGVAALYQSTRRPGFDVTHSSIPPLFSNYSGSSRENVASKYPPPALFHVVECDNTRDVCEQHANCCSVDESHTFVVKHVKAGLKSRSQIQNKSIVTTRI